MDLKYQLENTKKIETTKYYRFIKPNIKIKILNIFNKIFFY